MRVLTGEQFLVRVFIGESDKWHHRSLAHSVLRCISSAKGAGPPQVFRADSRRSGEKQVCAFRRSVIR